MVYSNFIGASTLTFVDTIYDSEIPYDSMSRWMQILNCFDIFGIDTARKELSAMGKLAIGHSD